MPKGIEDEQKIKEKKDVSLTEHGGQVGALTWCAFVRRNQASSFGGVINVFH